MAEADLSKVISAIMENPTLIEEIKKTLSGTQISEEKEVTEATVKEQEAAQESSADTNAVSDTVYVPTYQSSHKSRRNNLLRAMRPYLSEPRAKAVETMISIADILFVVREK